MKQKRQTKPIKTSVVGGVRMQCLIPTDCFSRDCHSFCA